MSSKTSHTFIPPLPPQGHDHQSNRLRNSTVRWGFAAVALHWSTALAVIGLFALGLWMTELTYYDPWYKQAPNIHKSIGVMVFIVSLVRLAWRLLDPAPKPVQGQGTWERKAAHATHWILYGALFAVMASGYLISTADGRAVSVFGLFEMPATLTSIEKQEDVAGVVHLWLAVSLICVVAAHALAALKHHFVDKDNTLKRMFARP